MIHFLRAIVHLIETFWAGFFDFWGDILSVRTQSQWKYQFMVEIFWHDWSDSQLNTTSERGSQLSGDNWRFQHSKQTETEHFYVKTKIRKKNTGRRERIHYSIPRLQQFCGILFSLQLLGSLSRWTSRYINTLWCCNWSRGYFRSLQLHDLHVVIFSTSSNYSAWLLRLICKVICHYL